MIYVLVYCSNKKELKAFKKNIKFTFRKKYKFIFFSDIDKACSYVSKHFISCFILCSENSNYKIFKWLNRFCLKQKNIKTVIINNNKDNNFAISCLNKGIAYFLIKPITYEDILTGIFYGVSGNSYHYTFFNENRINTLNQ